MNHPTPDGGPPAAETESTPADPRRSPMLRTAAWLLGAGLAAVVALGVWFRVSSLDSIPEVNGDEAFFGVQALRIRRGDAVQLFTPHHMPLSPFYTGVEVLLLRFAEPGLWLLRAPAMAGGLATLALAGVFAARHLGRRAAAIAVATLAATPAAIYWSRMGIDQSTTPLLSLILIAVAFAGSWTWTVLMFLACFLAHPTNLFLAPTVALIALARGWSASRSGPGRFGLELARIAGFGLLTLGLGLHILSGAKTHELGAAQNATPGGRYDLVRFLELLGRSLLGPCGGHGHSLGRPHDAAFWGVTLAALALGLPGLVRRRQWDRLALVAGAAAGALALFAAGGPEILRPDTTRYGMFLIVPCALAFAVLADSWLASAPGPRRLALRQAALLAVAVAMLASEHEYFFRPIREQQGESIWTLRSESRNQYVDALRSILRDARESGRTGGPAEVVTLDFWTQQPVEFLAIPRGSARIRSYRALGPDLDGQVARLREELEAGAYVARHLATEIPDLAERATPPGRTLKTWDVHRPGMPPVVISRLEPAAAPATAAGLAPGETARR